MDADTPPPPNGRTGGTPTRSYGGVIPADPGRRIALQLRDDRPDVWYPGQLRPFGGTTEAADASPLHAAAREAYEELGLTVRWRT